MWTPDQAWLNLETIGSYIFGQAKWAFSVVCAAGSHPTDVRMTTRFKDNDLTEGLTGAIHETGHALYEQGRNLEYDGLPVNQVSFSVWSIPNEKVLDVCLCQDID